jgi:hypothetical protein
MVTPSSAGLSLLYSRDHLPHLRGSEIFDRFPGCFRQWIALPENKVLEEFGAAKCATVQDTRDIEQWSAIIALRYRFWSRNGQRSIWKSGGTIVEPFAVATSSVLQ